jgi:D-alanyl-lipoteichoic acid acyltransferase DltB (MBOAT superfamily)
VGISFFTFQSMSYIIDAYRQIIPTERNLVRYASYVALFPQMVAGPIERAKAILPQLHSAPVITREDVSDGISLFVTGLFKKAVMADFLAVYVDRVYGSPDSYGSAALLFATYAFAWQIYFDFSGYTDMARGTARIMGIKLMLNFNNPYTAVDIGDFWRRWHISLSSWFKDYVYIPLGGNKTVKYRIWWNIFLTMLISGFWHGAAWTYVIWGALNGLGRLLSLRIEKTEFYVRKTPKIVKQLLVFHFICLTWIFFRAASLGDAMTIIKRIFSFAGGDPRIPVALVLLTVAVWCYQLVFSSSLGQILERRVCRVGAAALALILVIALSSPVQKQFIYFQF